MFYYLFQWLEGFGVPGSRLMDYITFRSGAAFILSLIVAMIFGRSIIRRLQKMQVGEIIRNLGLEGQMKKTGTPTMGGIIIILATVIPCLLVGRLDNVYMLLMLFATLWLGTLGFCDDYLKIRRHNKDGMSGKFKIIGQVGLGLIVGVTMYASPSMVIRQNHEIINQTSNEIEEVVYETEDIKSTQTTIPFVKENNFDYAWLTDWMGDHAATGGWILFILVAIFIVTATSNGANLTDGLDGLAAGCSAIIAVALAIMAYLGGSVIYSSYLNIMYIPGSEELSVFCAAFIGALIGFLWVQCLPGAGVHGRHRFAHHRRRAGRAGHPHPQGAAAAHSLRNLLRGGPLGDDSGGLFQIHKKTLWRGAARVPHDTPAPPLPEASLSPAWRCASTAPPTPSPSRKSSHGSGLCASFWP